MSFLDPTFMDLLKCHDEFVFYYNGIKYEIVNGDENGEGAGISLYLSDDLYGTFLQSFSNIDDFLTNAKIEDKHIKYIIKDIKLTR